VHVIFLSLKREETVSDTDDVVVCYGNANPGDVHLAAAIVAINDQIYELFGEPVPVSADADVQRSIAAAAS
jgi:hypothetical protein